MTLSKSPIALTKSCHLDPKPLMSSSPYNKDHLAPTKITPTLIPSFDHVAAQPLATSSTSLSVSQTLQLLIDQPDSTSSKEDLKKKDLEILDLDDESMASASAAQPEDEVHPFANEDMLDNCHPNLYGGPHSARIIKVKMPLYCRLLCDFMSLIDTSTTPRL
ncbi:unnamed protein product [Prunus armeniaca]